MINELKQFDKSHADAHQNVSKFVRGLGVKLKRFPYMCMPITPNNKSTNTKKTIKAIIVCIDPSTPFMILNTNSYMRIREYNANDLIITGNLLRILAILKARNTRSVRNAEIFPAPKSNRDTKESNVMTKSNMFDESEK